MREIKYRKETREVSVYDGETVTCDLCGGSEFDNEYIVSLRLESDMGNCGHQRTTRDVCAICYQNTIEEHWDKLYGIFQMNATEDLREQHGDI